MDGKGSIEMVSFAWFFTILVFAVVVRLVEDRRKKAIREMKIRKRELRIAEETLRLENEALKSKFAALSVGKDDRV